MKTRSHTRNSGKALLGPMLPQRGNENKQQVPFLGHLLPNKGVANFLYGVRVGMCPGIGTEG